MVRLPLSLLCLALFSGSRAFAEIAEPPPSAAVADKEISEFAKFQTIGELNARLQRRPVEIRRAIYFAVAVERKVLSASEAAELLLAVGPAEGSERAIKQLCSGSVAQNLGALYELRVARAFADRGAKIIEIRKPFKGDPAKQSTDIDLFIEMPPGQPVAIECKSTGKTAAVSVGADASTLLHFVADYPGTRVAFSFGTEPSPFAKKSLADKGIPVFSGTPAGQAAAFAASTTAKAP